MTYQVTINVITTPAKLFVATSPDVRGLFVHAETTKELWQRLGDVVPVLLDLNHNIKDTPL